MTTNSGKARPTSHHYFSHGLKLHFLDWGDITSKPVLLIHGMQYHCHNWDWTSEALCDDYHILAPDLRGHGDSDWSKESGYSNLDYVYDIAQLVEQQELRSNLADLQNDIPPALWTDLAKIGVSEPMATGQHSLCRGPHPAIADEPSTGPKHLPIQRKQDAVNCAKL